MAANFWKRMGFVLGVCGNLSLSWAEVPTVKQLAPRQGCFRSGKVKVHVGPGKQYPVEWVFVCKDFPVWVLAEFDQWRRVKAADQTEGWVHKSLLSFRKTYLTDQESFLFSRPSVKAKKVARVCSGSVVVEQKEKKGWVKVSVNDSQQNRLTGWMKRAVFLSFDPKARVR